MAPEGVGHLARLLGALGRVLLEAAHQDVLELLADLGAEGPWRLGDLVHDPVEDRLDLPREGRLAQEAFVEDDAEGVDVRAAVEGPRCDLLGRQVGDRSDERSRLRQAGFGGRVRQTEVHDPHARPGAVLAGDHDVGRLDVAVDDPARVAVLERVGHLDPDVHHLAEVQRLVPDQPQQVRALRDGHHEEERALVTPEVVDRHDRGVVHLGDELGLALEALLDLGRQVRRRDELDRHLAIQEWIPGTIDHSHASAAELPEDLVAVGELRIDQACGV